MLGRKESTRYRELRFFLWGEKKKRVQLNETAES